MIKKTPYILLAVLLCFALLADFATARSKYDQPDDYRVKDVRVSNILKYNVPTGRKLQNATSDKEAVLFETDSDLQERFINKSTLGVAGPNGISSPGMEIRTTKEDWQYSVKGRYIDFSATVPSIQFGYTDLQSATNEDRGYAVNYYDPTAGGSWPRGLGVGCRIQAADTEGRWMTSVVAPDGKIILAGEDAVSDPEQAHYYSNVTLHGCFWGGGSEIPQSQYSAGFIDTTSNLRHPIVDIQVVGIDTITHIVAHSSTFHTLDPTAPSVTDLVIQYFRKTGTGQLGLGTVWTGPTTIDTAQYRGVIASSRFDARVAIAYNHHTPTAYINDNGSDNDVYYRESTDGGLIWGAPVNITNYDRTQVSYGPWIEVQTLYDTGGDLHIIWNGNPYPADVYDSLGFFFGDFSCSLFHWTTRTGLISRIANRDYGIEWNTQVCGMGGTNALYLAFFNISECNGKLYVTYAGWNDVFGDGEIDDCASSFGDAPSRVFQANGELYMHVSASLDGLLWDAARNFTNTKTPGCDSVGFGGVCMNDTKVMMARYGYDSASYGQPLTFPGNELLVIDSGWSGSHYLNMFYLEDHAPGNAAIGRGTWYTDNPLNWIRTGCIDPVTAAQIAFTPTGIGFPSYTTHGTSEVVTIELVNDGNTALIGTIGAVETSGPAGWLTTSTGAFNIVAGVGNTGTFDVVLNGNLNINSPGTVVGLNGEVYMLSNAPTPRDSVSFTITNFLIADTVVALEFDTVSTGVTQLILSSNGEMGVNGTGGANLDYTGLGVDCDTTGNAEVYLYSGGPFVIQDINGDGSDFDLSYAMFSGGGFLTDTDFKRVIGAGFNTPLFTAGANFESYTTGSFVNWDTTIAMEKTLWAPTGGGDSTAFIIQCLKVYSIDGNSHNNLAIGEFIDWDIPADVGSNNDAFVTTGGNTVYYVGTDTATGLKCQDNSGRIGAQGFLGWYTNTEFNGDNCVNNSTFHGTYGARNDTLFEYQGTEGDTLAEFWWNNTLNNTGLNGLADGTDLHAVTTFTHGINLGATDTLTFYSVVTTVENGTVTDLDNNLAAACAWYDENLRAACGVCGCCVGLTGNVDNDPGDNTDIGDLTKLIDFLFISGVPPVCMEEANTDGDPGGNVDIGDLTKLIDFLFISGTPTAACQ